MSKLVIGLIVLFFIIIFIAVIGIVLMAQSSESDDPDEPNIPEDSDTCEGCENCANCSIESVCVDPDTGDPMIKQSECISNDGEICPPCNCASCCPDVECGCTEYKPIISGNIYPTEFFTGKSGAYDYPHISCVSLAKNTAKVGDIIVVSGNYLRNVTSDVVKNPPSFAFKNTKTNLSSTAEIYSSDFYHLSYYLIVPEVDDGEYTVIINNPGFDNNNGFKPATINVASEYSIVDIPFDQQTKQEYDHAYTGSAALNQQVGRRGDLVMLSGNRMSELTGEIRFVQRDTNTPFIAASRNYDWSYSSLFVFVPDNITPGLYYVDSSKNPFDPSYNLGEDSYPRFEIIE